MSKPVVHHLKTEREFFEATLKGEKDFEARIDDRSPSFEKGHRLTLEEVDESGTRTGRTTNREITYVLRGERFGIRNGFAILGNKPVAR